MVGLDSNFIVGDEVIPLDAEKHTETPSIRASSLVTSAVFPPMKNLVHVLVIRSDVVFAAAARRVRVQDNSDAEPGRRDRRQLPLLADRSRSQPDLPSRCA